MIAENIMGDMTLAHAAMSILWGNNYWVWFFRLGTSSPQSLFQSEFKCEIFVMVVLFSFYLNEFIMVLRLSGDQFGLLS